MANPSSIGLYLLLTGFIVSCHVESTTPLYFGQGAMIGEVTDHSSIFQTRLTKTDTIIGGDIPGAEGWIRFSWWPTNYPGQRNSSPWLAAVPTHDFTVKYQAHQLLNNTIYQYHAFACLDTLSKDDNKIRGFFRTNPGDLVQDSLSFVVVTGMNYYFFHYGKYDSKAAYVGPDKNLGYPALASIANLQPDYFIGTGDNVYFDHPTTKNYSSAINEGKNPSPGMFTGKEVISERGMRRKYHLQFCQPRFRKLFASVGTYWEKDDHDYRVNDSDPYIDFPISHELGIKNFREQLPVVDPSKSEAETYRTHRLNRDVQLWFLEGRDFRSANESPDGPGKTIWGDKQKVWLQETLLSSDAKYKLIISPTPMVGPDDARKRDNHVNPRGFRKEGEAFFEWLSGNKFSTDRLFIICGDRHWQYHAIHPSGYQEFSCGALVDANARSGRLAGDSLSTDPDGIIRQKYIQGSEDQASGGFLHVKSSLLELGSGLIFDFYDEQGALLYEFTAD